jgi:hypothetical protein
MTGETQDLETGSDIYGDEVLKAKRVEEVGIIGKRVIATVVVKEFKKASGDVDKKICLGFGGFKGKLISLNLTNYKACREMFGDAFRLWVGSTVEITVAKAKYAGKEVPSTVIVPVKKK